MEKLHSTDLKEIACNPFSYCILIFRSCSASGVATANPPQPIWLWLDPAAPWSRRLCPPHLADPGPRARIPRGPGAAGPARGVLGPRHSWRNTNCPCSAPCPGGAPAQPSGGSLSFVLEVLIRLHPGFWAMSSPGSKLPPPPEQPQYWRGI